MLMNYGGNVCILTFLNDDEEPELFSCLNMLSFPQCIGFPDHNVKHGKYTTEVYIFGVSQDDAMLIEAEIRRHAQYFRERMLNTFDKIKEHYCGIISGDGKYEGCTRCTHYKNNDCNWKYMYQYTDYASDCCDFERDESK